MSQVHYLGFGAGFLILYFLFLYLGKLPSMESMQKFVTMLDTKGGNIMVLVLLALYFFHDAQVMYYIVIDKIKDGTLSTDNGIALNGLMFATGAFSGVSGALLKVMSGADPKPGANSLGTLDSPSPSSTPAPPPAIAPVGITTQGNTVPENKQVIE